MFSLQQLPASASDDGEEDEGDGPQRANEETPVEGCGNESISCVATRGGKMKKRPEEAEMLFY